MPRAALEGVGVTMLGAVFFVVGLALEAVVLNLVLAALPLGVSELGIRIRVMAIADGAYVFEFVAAAAATRCGGWVARRGSRRRAAIGTRALCGVGAVLSAVVLGALSLERGSTVGQWLVGIGLVGLGATLGGTHWRRPGRADTEAMSDEPRPARRRPVRGSLQQMLRTAAAGTLAVAIGLVGPTMAAAGSGAGDGGGAAGAPPELPAYPAYPAPAGQAADLPPLSVCILSQESVDISSSSIVVLAASGSDVSLTEYEQPTVKGKLQWLVRADFSSNAGLGAVVGAQYEFERREARPRPRRRGDRGPRGVHLAHLVLRRYRQVSC